MYVYNTSYIPSKLSQALALVASIRNVLFSKSVGDIDWDSLNFLQSLQKNAG
jgi:hypothetical protein